MNKPHGEVTSAPSELVITEIRGQVLWLTVNREGARNALNDEVLAAMARAIQDAGADSSLRAIVVTGAGNRAFSAGGDIKSGAATFDFDYSRPSTNYADLMRAANQSNLPTLARVNGHCLAGGMGLLSMCDMAIASSKATFGLPEVKLGMFPMQVSASLRRILPPRLFAEMCYSGESINAQEALAHGLVNYVVEPEALDEKVQWLLDRIVPRSPTAIRRGKYALRATQDMSFEQSIAYMETQISTLALTKDSSEGIASFNEKRAPAWSGR